MKQLIFIVAAILFSCTEKSEDRKAKTYSPIDPPSSSERNSITSETTVEESENRTEDLTRQEISLLPLVETVPVSAIVNTFAKKFQAKAAAGINWTPSRVCPPTDDSLVHCSGNTTCEEASTELNKFYCDLGGENRATMSSISRGYGTADVVLLYKFANNICAKPSTIVSLSVSKVNTEQEFISKLITKMIGYDTSDSEYQAEYDFIHDSILLEGFEGEIPNNIVTHANYSDVFFRTCVYLTVHPSHFLY